MSNQRTGSVGPTDGVHFTHRLSLRENRATELPNGTTTHRVYYTLTFTCLSVTHLQRTSLILVAWRHVPSTNGLGINEVAKRRRPSLYFAADMHEGGKLDTIRYRNGTD